MFNRSLPRSRPGRVLIAAVAVTALTLAGCSGGEPAPTTSDPNAPVTLKLALFGDSAAVKPLIDEYKRQRPNVTVELNTVANAEDARTNLLTKLAAGNGLADVEQLEISWVGQLQRYSSKFVPVAQDEYGPFVNIQTEPVKTEDGGTYAYGFGTGPTAMCYRAELLEKAGMASDPQAVAGMMGGTWAEYFEAGKKYAAAGGTGKWFDSSYLIYNAQVEQLPFPYEQADGTVAVNNPELEKIFKDTLALAPTLSAKLGVFSEDWNSGMATGKYATLACPSWLLTTIQGNAKDVADWRIADAFPGGGGNLGGSFLAVPTQSKNPEQAAALASWLSAPEQQIAAFKEGSAFPSRVQALDSPDLAGVTNPYFGDAKVGTIFANRSKAITTVPYKGPNYIAIDTAAFNAVTRVESGQQSVDEAWQQFVTEAEAAAK